jgi:hypothetical protein
VHSSAILPADPKALAGMAEATVQRMLTDGMKSELGDPIDKDKWAAHMPLGIVATKKPDELKGLQIYFDAGTDDHYGFFEPNVQLAAAMEKHGHAHLFRPVEEGGHAWSSPTMKQSLATSLRFVGLALSGKAAVTELQKELDGAVETGAKKGEAKDAGK